MTRSCTLSLARGDILARGGQRSHVNTRLRRGEPNLRYELDRGLCLSSDFTFGVSIFTRSFRQTSVFIVQTPASEKYSQVTNLIVFEDHNSLQRDLVKIDHIHTNLAHESPSAERFAWILLDFASAPNCRGSASRPPTSARTS
ncbi:hypothetical protein DFH11DRAFT_1637762 [Phellopilus nigrolimitatus]|nr:hypothetical protein DFH11DRAFT_1637762 [Phellopilus nigrolimitatus]